MDPAPTYDCLTCGACCYGPDDYVAVIGTDRLRMTAQSIARYTHKRGDRTFMNMRDGHCAALHVRQGHYSCRIYGQRPQPCHVVEPGNKECLDARRRRGVDQG